MVKFTPFGVLQRIFGSPDLNQNKHDNCAKIIHSDGKISIKSKVCVRQKSTIGYEKVTTYSQTDKTTDYSYESVLGKKYSNVKNESKIFAQTSPEDSSLKQQNDGSHSNDTHFIVHDFSKSVSKAKVDQSTNNPQIYAVYRTVSDLKEELQKKCCDSTNNADCEKCYCDHCGAMTVVQDSLKHPLTYETRENLKVSDELRRKYRKYKRIKTVTEDPAFVRLVEQCNKLEVKITELEENLIVKESRNTALRLMYDMYTQSSTTSIQATEAIPKIIGSYNTSKDFSSKRDDSKIFCLPKHLFRNKPTSPKRSTKAQMTDPILARQENHFHMKQIPRKGIGTNKLSSPVVDSPAPLVGTETNGQISRIPRITRSPSAILSSLTRFGNNEQLNTMPRKPVTYPRNKFKLRSQNYTNKKENTTPAVKNNDNATKISPDSEKPYEIEIDNKIDNKLRSRFAQFRNKYKSQTSLGSKDNTQKMSTNTSGLDINHLRKHHEDSKITIIKSKSSIRNTDVKFAESKANTNPDRFTPTFNQNKLLDRNTRSKSPSTSRNASRTTSPEKKIIKSKILDLIMANYESNKVLNNINSHRTTVRKEVSQMLKIYECDDLNKIAKILEQSEEIIKHNDNASIEENVLRIENYQDENKINMSESDENATDQKRVNINVTEKYIKPNINTKEEVQSKSLQKSMDKHIESWSIHPDKIPNISLLKSISFVNDESESTTTESTQIEQDTKIARPDSKSGKRLNSNVSDAKYVSFANEESNNSRNVRPVTTKRECKITKPILNSSAFDTLAVSDTSDNSPTGKVTPETSKKESRAEKKKLKIVKKEPDISKKESKIPVPIVASVNSGLSIPARSRSRNRISPIKSTKTSIACEKTPIITLPPMRLFQRHHKDERNRNESIGKSTPATKPPFTSSKYCVESRVIKPWVTTNIDTGKLSTRTSRLMTGYQGRQESPICKNTISDISTLSFNEARQYLNNRMSLLEETAEKIQLLAYDFKGT